MTDAVVDTVQPDAILDHIDIDALLDRIDVNAVLARVNINALLGRVEMNAVMARVDMNALLAPVDINALLERVDLNALLRDVEMDTLLARVNVNALLDGVDVDALLSRVELKDLLDRVDLNALLERVDLDALLGRVDLDQLLAGVDLKAVIARSGVPEIIAESTSKVAGSALDVGRRQVVGLDVLTNRTVNKMMRRAPEAVPAGPPLLTAAASTTAREQVTGQYAGPLTRAVAAVIDGTFVFVTYTLGYAGLSLLLSAFFNKSLAGDRGGLWATVALLVWWFVYTLSCQVVSGQVLGMAIIGLRVVNANGETLSAKRAVARTFAFPLSLLLLCIGLLPIIFQRAHRALHDMIAGTAVVYDWGDRPAEVSAPLSQFLNRASRKSPDVELPPV